MKNILYGFKAFQILFILINLMKADAKRDLILENINQCEKTEYPVEFQNFQAVITKNKLNFRGNLTINVDQPLDSILIDVLYHRCAIKTGRCNDPLPLQIKNVCRFLTDKSFLGPKLAQFFDPPLYCPFEKVNQYLKRSNSFINTSCAKTKIRHFFKRPSLKSEM